MVICRVIDLYGRVLLSSNNCNIMENNTCHNDVTCPLWGDPELLQALEPGFEYPYGHLIPALVLQWATLKRCRGPRQ